ncbi:MAG: hypothetical protein ACLT4C_04460 [Butyricicoccus sp.]
MSVSAAFTLDGMTAEPVIISTLDKPAQMLAERAQVNAFRLFRIFV